jgi:outer membrane protein
MIFGSRLKTHGNHARSQTKSYCPDCASPDRPNRSHSAARPAVDEQTISAFQGVRSAVLVEAATASQALAAAEARDSVSYEMRVGMKPQLDLLDAEREATAAAVNEISAQSDRIVTAYRLLALLGR